MLDDKEDYGSNEALKQAKTSICRGPMAGNRENQNSEYINKFNCAEIFYIV
jgi:hypothetical protein